MRITVFSILSLCGLAFPAMAEPSPLRQQLFEADKRAALSGFDAGQKQACLTAFNQRYDAKYSLKETLALNESFSLEAYDMLFWKGNGSLQRGLVFSGAVADSSGKPAGNLMCYYAVTDYRMEFQSAYVLPQRAGEATLASTASY